MTQETLSAEEAVRQFWASLTDRSTVMLGVHGSDERLQPMTAFSEPETGLIWFFTRNDTDLARETRPGSEGRMIFAARNEELFADISGTLLIDCDRPRINKYWNAVVAAWYPEGKDDPHLTLLRFQPKNGQVWISKQGLLRFAFQVTKANVAKTKPDLGGSAEVTFPR